MKSTKKIGYFLIGVSLFLISTLLFFTLIDLFTFDKTSNKKDNYVQNDVVYELPETLVFSANTLAAALESGQTVDVKVKATVYPYNASNQKVDYSLAWGEAPIHSNENVTDYVSCVQDSAGSLYATISCKKAFDTDVIVLTVTTRDGGFTDSTKICFKGIASFFAIDTDVYTPLNDSLRGDYFEFLTNKTYEFNLYSTNVFDKTTVDYEIVSYGLTHYSGSNSYFFTAYLTFTGNWPDIESGYCDSISTRPFKEFNGDLESFFDLAIEDDVLRIAVKGNTLNSYSLGNTSFPDDTGYMNAYDWFVDLEAHPNVKDYVIDGDVTLEQASDFNNTLLKETYFFVKVKDSISGLEDELRFIIEESVSGVNMNSSSLTF